jgi:hypothetical protein
MDVVELSKAYSSAVAGEAITLARLWDAFVRIASTPVKGASGEPTDDFVEFTASDAEPKWPGDPPPPATVVVSMIRCPAPLHRRRDRTVEQGAG